MKRHAAAAPTEQHPLKLITPPIRRAALQERVKTIPRYANANAYATHAVLRIVEEQVSAGNLPEWILSDDSAIIGAAAWRAFERDLFDSHKRVDAPKESVTPEPSLMLTGGDNERRRRDIRGQ